MVPDGPAEKASLRSGEILEAISGFSTRDMSVGQANMLLQGAPGTAVKVAVVRRGKTEPQEISINRAVIGPQHIVADRVADDVAYVRLPAMDPLDVTELRDKLTQFDKQGVHKLVLDLRDCTRGEVPGRCCRGPTFPFFRQDYLSRRPNRRAQGLHGGSGQSRVARAGGRFDLARALRAPRKFWLGRSRATSAVTSSANGPLAPHPSRR